MVLKLFSLLTSLYILKFIEISKELLFIWIISFDT